jgi:hypothetical protein
VKKNIGPIHQLHPATPNEACELRIVIEYGNQQPTQELKQATCAEKKPPRKKKKKKKTNAFC